MAQSWRFNSETGGSETADRFARQVASQALNCLGDQRLDTALLFALESRNAHVGDAATDANIRRAEQSALGVAHGAAPIRSHCTAAAPRSVRMGGCSRRQVAAGSSFGTSRRTASQPPVRHAEERCSASSSVRRKAGTSGRSDSNLRFWNLATRSPDGEPLTVHGGTAVTLAFSPDGRTFATGGGDKAISFWDLATRQPIGEPLTGHTSNVESLAFSRDGRTLASGSWDGTVILWDVGAHSPLGPPLSVEAALGQPFGQVESVAFSPDGKLLAAGGGGGAVLWEVASSKPASPLLHHPSGGVTSVVFSPDGRYLAAGSSGKPAQ
jgi:dipeptidyl aminopeptidase/acylaminoacyl peptidase